MSDQSMEQRQVARGDAATDAPPATPPPARAAPETALKVVETKVEYPSPLIRHTRRCNGRQLCNCALRLESALFHKNLLERAVKKRRADAEEAETEAMGEKQQAQLQPQRGEEEEKPPAKEAEPSRRMGLRSRTPSAKLVASRQDPSGPAKRTQKKQKTTKAAKAAAAKARSAARAKHYVTVTRLGEFDFDIKLLIASFLPPAALAMLGMTNRTWGGEVERMAQHTAAAFLKVAARQDRLLKGEKARADTWSRYMHKHMNSVFKVFVFYTGYKTGQMRQDFAHWAFGVVEFDPNEPHHAILPNTWKFHEHEPWVPRRANGKMGEWHLRNKYKPSRAPKRFVEQVKEWTITLRPGSFVAISYQNVGSEEPAWWEAQVWYAWRQDGNLDPVIAYDSETDTRYEVAPDNLVEHFQRHPLHVVDVTTTPSRVCGACAARGRGFKFCHIDKGHPML